MERPSLHPAMGCVCIDVDGARFPCIWGGSAVLERYIVILWVDSTEVGWEGYELILLFGGGEGFEGCVTVPIKHLGGWWYSDDVSYVCSSRFH